MPKLEELEEGVAAAKREVAVAEALAKEYRRKQHMAEEEAGRASHRLNEAREALEEAVLKQHEAIHGKPVSFDDRYEFEKRWDAKVAEQQRRQEEYVAHREAEQRNQEELQRKNTEDILKEMDVRIDGQIVPAEVIRTNLGL
jgi:flagellar biosynthesis GTPase FlhF